MLLYLVVIIRTRDPMKFINNIFTNWIEAIERCAMDRYRLSPQYRLDEIKKQLEENNRMLEKLIKTTEKV